MWKSVRRLLLVPSLLISSTQAAAAKVYLPNGDFFQGFNEHSCYWKDYDQHNEWDMESTSSDPRLCALACANHERCTGFEMSFDPTYPYCAFWYDGACGHEEMRFSGAGMPHHNPTVATYVLMDGVARFYDKECDYDALNMTEGHNLVRDMRRMSSHECVDVCAENATCTGSRHAVNSNGECDLFLDQSCTMSDLDDAHKIVTTLRYPLSAPDPPFKDAYNTCNPFSEVLRGYRTCAEYVKAFPCDCLVELGDACTNTNASDEGTHKGSMWTRRTAHQCEGQRLDSPSVNGSLAMCKQTCMDNHDCGCFNTQPTAHVHGRHTCIFYAPKDDTPVEAVVTHGPLVPGNDSNSYAITRVSYRPTDTLNKLCPSECAADHSKDCMEPSLIHNSWFAASLIVLCVLAPFAMMALCTLAFGGYLRRRFCPSWQGPFQAEQPASTVPKMNKEELNSMAVEKFSSNSELKYGETECSICIMEFEEGDMMRVMKCGHRFHKECVDEWLSRYQAVCPLCKNSMLSSGDADGDIEMGEIAAEDNEGDDGPTPESSPPIPSPRNDVGERRSVSLNDDEARTALAAPLLTDDNSSLLANDALVDANDALEDDGVAMDILLRSPSLHTEK